MKFSPATFLHGILLITSPISPVTKVWGEEIRTYRDTYNDEMERREETKKNTHNENKKKDEDCAPHPLSLAFKPPDAI